jgi:hypothetical protein
MTLYRGCGALALTALMCWPQALTAQTAPKPQPPAAQPQTPPPPAPAQPQTPPPTAQAKPPTPPPPTPAPAQPQTPPATPPGAPPAALQPDPYTYGGVGRRDPFISLLGRGSDSRNQASRPPGVAGLMINEVAVRGIVETPKGFVALIQGPDNRSYKVRPNDRLLDGTVKAIMKDQVIFSQEVNDPLSLVKVKEVPKRIREEGK